MESSRLPSVAAIVDTEHGGVDDLLAQFAFGLQKEGWRVRGLVQQSRDGTKDTTVLLDLSAGTSFPLFQDLGPGSHACRVDPGGVAAASVVLRRALDEGADLVIANRFGALESTGSGLAGDMLAVMSARMPLLTVVSELYLAEWRRFSGDLGLDLPPRLEALQAWFSSVRTRPQLR
jgi:uncharacterized protein DUF2478